MHLRKIFDETVHARVKSREKMRKYEEERLKKTEQMFAMDLLIEKTLRKAENGRFFC